MSKYALKENEDQAREHLRAFWAGSSLGRPALGITCRNGQFASEPFDYSGKPRKQWDLDPDWHVWNTRQALHATIPLAEAMPHSLASFGTHLWLIAELIGGCYEWGDGTTWLSRQPDIWQRDVPAFEPTHPVVADLTKAMRASAAEAGMQGFLCPPALMDPLTTLAALRGEEQFMLDLYDQPQKVRRFSGELATLSIDCHRYFQRLCEDMGYGENASWLALTAEGTSDAVQCDTAIMLSPEMFRQFVLPDLGRLVEYFDYPVYHLDGNAQRRHFDCLQTLPGLKAIQWNPDPGQQDPHEWVDLFREVRSRGWGLVFLAGYTKTVDNALFLADTLGPDGLYIALPPFDTRDEAEDAIAKVSAACQG